MDTLFWQVSVDHSMDIQYQRYTLQTKVARLGINPSIGRHVARCRRWAHAPAIHFYHEKRVAWVSISMHACDSVPIVMGLRLAALQAAGAPVLCLVDIHVSVSLSGIYTCELARCN